MAKGVSLGRSVFAAILAVGFGGGGFDADQSEILFAATDGDIAFLFLN